MENAHVADEELCNRRVRSHGFILARYACEFSICCISVRNGRVLGFL